MNCRVLSPVDPFVRNAGATGSGADDLPPAVRRRCRPPSSTSGANYALRPTCRSTTTRACRYISACSTPRSTAARFHTGVSTGQGRRFVRFCRATLPHVTAVHPMDGARHANGQWTCDSRLPIRVAVPQPRDPPLPPPEPCEEPVPPELFDPVEPYIFFSFPAFFVFSVPPASCPFASASPDIPCFTSECPLPVLALSFR